LYADSGVENVNGEVNATLFSACLDRILAQVEVGFSNSIVDGVLALPEAPVAFPKHLGHGSAGSCARGILRHRAQHEDATPRVRRADS